MGLCKSPPQGWSIHCPSTGALYHGLSSRKWQIADNITDFYVNSLFVCSFDFFGSLVLHCVPLLCHDMDSALFQSDWLHFVIWVPLYRQKGPDFGKSFMRLMVLRQFVKLQ